MRLSKYPAAGPPKAERRDIRSWSACAASGKTVLLDHLYRRSLAEGQAAIKIKAPEYQTLADLLVPNRRRAPLPP